MSTELKNYESSPIEFMHGRLMDEFHAWRKTITDDTIVEIDGIDFNRIIMKAKKDTYENIWKKYNIWYKTIEGILNYRIWVWKSLLYLKNNNYGI